MRYIQSFSNSGAVQTALDNQELGKPYVAFDGTKIDWNSKERVINYENQYLTFNIISVGEMGRITCQEGSIYYSLNNGDWISLASQGRTIFVEAGDVIRFKGEITNYNSSLSFTSTEVTFEACGNVMSLVYGDNFVGQTSFPQNSYMNFYSLFNQNTGITSAENLILPATTLTNYCYAYMFNGCINLTTAPVLPATVVSDGGMYEHMFYNCSSLNYVKCLATSIPANGFSGWLGSYEFPLPSTGTFVKAASMNDWPTGDNGIPDGWTVQDAA